jgi:ribosomal protein S18 acetylase RimI-like enzyme
MLPQPPAAPDVTWRPPTKNDASLLAAHTRKIHEVERLDFLPSAEFFEWMLGQPGIDPAEDMLVGLVGDTLVADAGTWLHSGDSGARCIIWGEASPDHPDLVGFLLEWAKARAQQRLAAQPEQLPKVIRTSVEEHRSSQRAAIEAAGFGTPRGFVAMARPLSDLPPISPAPSGVEVVGWSDDLEEAVRLASNASFADHWGSLPMDAAEFKGFHSDNPTFRPDLSFLAMVDGSVVSFSLCEVDDEDNKDRATNDLFINRVGTIGSHRGRGLASHLILRSMQAAVSAGGLDRVALDVDEMSHTNATLVYERLGFETYARTLSYTISS